MSSNISLNMTKGKGINYALLEYAKKNNYDLSDGTVNKAEWSETTKELAKIQEERKTNNKNSIFKGGSETNGDWHKNMVVKQGSTVDFSQEEMDRLLSKMGVSKKAAPTAVDSTKKTGTTTQNQKTESGYSTPISEYLKNNKTSALDKWEEKVEDADEAQSKVDDFHIMDDKTQKEYNQALIDKDNKKAAKIYQNAMLKTSQEEIETYDKNGDKMINTPEQIKKDRVDFFLKYENLNNPNRDKSIDPENKNHGIISNKEALELAKESKYQHDLIDIDGDGKINDNEYASYLYAIDSDNESHIGNGKISQKEFVDSQETLMTKSGKGLEDFKARMRGFYDLLKNNK